MQDIQEQISKAINESINKMKDGIVDDINKPIYEFVATYDAGTLTRYIGG